ncbi:hypothetical protein G9A89_004460 [Geosiphon pyriformis]|nr:hypothetical protein G9A89_004460 [Geosiphon pyriformis]
MCNIKSDKFLLVIKELPNKKAAGVSETETSNKGKQKLKQYSRTTLNTPTLQKTTAKHLQTPEQGTSVKLPLSITPFPILLVQPQTPSLPLSCFFRPEDFQSPRNPTKQQEPISTSANIIDYLQENESNHSESLESKETESEPEEIPENEEEMATAYIAKIPEFTGENNDTSLQEWLDKVQKAEDTNGWIAARMLKAIPYFLQGIAGEYYYPPAPQSMQQQYQQPLPIQPYQTPPTQQYQVPVRRLVQHNQFTPQNQLQNNHNRINPNNQLVSQNSGQQRPNHYHTQPSYFTIPEESDFQQTALSEGKIAAPRSNSFNHTIPPAQIAQNANLSDIFPFEFEANESSFLLSNAAVNEQKAITVMYIEATVEGKSIRLILDSGLAGSIITYQLMQQLKQNVDRPAQTVIVTADDMKKTLVREIDDFPFSIDGITIPVKVLVMNAPQYQALVGNDWLLKANANLNWKTQELKISYQGQYIIVPATCGTFNKRSEKAPVFEFEEEKEIPLTKTYMALESISNWTEETKQEIFEESRR